VDVCTCKDSSVSKSVLFGWSLTVSPDDAPSGDAQYNDLRLKAFRIVVPRLVHDMLQGLYPAKCVLDALPGISREAKDVLSDLQSSAHRSEYEPIIEQSQ
jgi:hypothetical protein